MTKAQVFISHSAKDDEIADAIPLDAESDPRKRRLKYARAVRDAIVAGLGAKFEILLDRAGLDPGDQWRIKLLRWLGACDAAVVLLSEDSIRSRWVLQEATIATWRKWLRPDGLLLVPVLLSDLTAEQLEQAGFSPLQIREFQGVKLPGTPALTAADAQQIAALVVQRLADLKHDDASSDGMQLWVHDVAVKLARIDERILVRARKPLGIDDDDWADFLDRATTVAYRLLHTDLVAIGDALEQLKSDLSFDALAVLSDKLMPTWVPAAAAAALVSPPEDRATVSGAGWFALNTDMPTTARDYALRAYCSPNWWEGRCLDFDEPFGEGQEIEAVQELTRRIRAQLRIPDMLPAAILEQQVARRPFFVVVGNNVATTGKLQQEVARSSALKSITFVILAGPKWARPGENGAVIMRLTPPLDPQKELDALGAQIFIRNLGTKGATK